MQKIALLLSVVAFGTTSAMAADLPVKAPPPVFLPEYSWTGVYVGANFGGAWTSQSAFWPNGFGTLNFNHDGSFGVGGLHAGAQYQWANNWVLGLDISWFSGFKDTQVVGTPNAGCPNPADFCAAGLASVVTVGPRLGYAFRDFLVYGTAGYASGEINVSAVTPGGVFDDFSKRKGGWFAGAGVDYAAWKGRQTAIIVGLEYKHIDLGTASMNSPADGVPFCAGDCRLVKTSADVVQARFSLKWDPITPLGPVVAKY
ncbi:MAG TPA: outer membrane beta-barrel protein [Bradyrhizobium sp.]|uniref:outer membrane protein n=1 Tax=Bradyrhizobium sp. TaxID=376 RepID=UPI002D80CEF4|nr:outer membrane beta-barrel protein [Bradyrhizobium sp.]HET7886398.1 outer membrane beta-barrel protein [Bradyrhizobium sp.]